MTHAVCSDGFHGLHMGEVSADRAFVKMHGLRNHFVMFDHRVDRRVFRQHAIVRICDVQTGIGTEQLLTIELPSPGIATQACGTGVCVAAFAARLKGLSDSNHFTVHLPAGPLSITIEGNMALTAGPVAYCCRGFVAADKGLRL